jgi:hypothetical protein
MNLEGEYAIDKSRRAHRIASALVLALWIILSFYMRGLGQAFKTAVYCELPMSASVYPKRWQAIQGGFGAEGELFYERSYPILLCWGWMVSPLVCATVSADSLRSQQMNPRRRPHRGRQRRTSSLVRFAL